MHELHEKCGVFGAFGQNLEAARTVHRGLWALQHRGQEGSGIVSADGSGMFVHKGTGLVSHVFSEADVARLPGHLAIGHNRYSTSGGSLSTHVQPVFNGDNVLALAHNGNLPDTTSLQIFLREHGISTNGRNDSELMHLALTHFMVKGATLPQAMERCWPLFKGVFSLLLMTNNELVAVRDQCGVRPLALGHLANGYVVASETCALATVNATDIREVQPGEMVVIDERGLRVQQLAPPTPRLDVFEFVYFARWDSIIAGQRVYLVRKRLGQELAREVSIEADVVIPVPESGIPAANGFGQALGLPVDNGFTKNHYIHRTFIRPDQSTRETGVALKLNPVPELFDGQRVVIIDDSIVRGTTSRWLVNAARKLGARKVHLLVSSPPVRYPDFYGIDTPDQSNLLAAGRSIDEMQDFIGADSLRFLSLEGMLRAVGVPREQLCLSCFTGEYPVDIGARRADIKQIECR